MTVNEDLTYTRCFTMPSHRVTIWNAVPHIFIYSDGRLILGHSRGQTARGGRAVVG